MFAIDFYIFLNQRSLRITKLTSSIFKLGLQIVPEFGFLQWFIATGHSARSDTVLCMNHSVEPWTNQHHRGSQSRINGPYCRTMDHSAESWTTVQNHGSQYWHGPHCRIMEHVAESSHNAESWASAQIMDHSAELSTGPQRGILDHITDSQETYRREVYKQYI